jgi:hypothetical protein
MIPLPPDAGRALAEAVEKVLSAADRLLGLASDLQNPAARDSVLQWGRALFEVARSLMNALPDDPRALAPGFRRVLEMSDDLARLAEAEPNQNLRAALLDQVRLLVEAGSSYAPAIKTAAERERAPWARLLPQ